MTDDSKSLTLINAEEFRAKLGIRSASRFYELAKTDPRFPKAIKRGRRFSRFVLGEADNYIKALIAERDQPQVSA